MVPVILLETLTKGVFSVSPNLCGKFRQARVCIGVKGKNAARKLEHSLRRDIRKLGKFLGNCSERQKKKNPKMRRVYGASVTMSNVLTLASWRSQEKRARN